MKYTLSILVQNQPGVLVRVASMFSRRGFNIHSLTVGVTQQPDYSRITVVIYGTEAIISQVKKQLEKLIEVLAVQILPPESSVTRGMALVKVQTRDHRLEVLKLAEIFRATVIDLREHTVIFEITGEEDKIEAFSDVLRPYGILELIQTGQVALERGASTIQQGGETCR